MSGNFEWQTEEDWQGEDTAVSHNISAPFLSRFKRIRPIFLLPILVALLVAIGVNQRVQSATRQVDTAVLATHHFMLQSALARDIELFGLNLSDEDKQWHSLQRVLLRRMLFFDRGGFNIWLDHALAQEQLTNQTLPTEVTLSPDLQRAEVTTWLPFLTETITNSVQPLTLQHTAVYHFEDQQWLRTSPTDTWGATQHFVGQRLMLSYPEKDAAFSDYFARTLDKQLQVLCRDDPRLDCPESLKIHLIFDTEHDALLTLNDPFPGYRFRILWGGDRNNRTHKLTLPTPRLVGLPATDEARAILQKGYSSWVLTWFLTRTQVEIPFEQVAEILADHNLTVPPPHGYDPLLVKAEPPLPLPNNKVSLSCDGGNHPATAWQYDLHTEVWTPQFKPPCTDCLTSGLTATNRFSPDRQYFFAEDEYSETVSLSQANGRLLIQFTEARQPYWLDGQTFALIVEGDVIFAQLDTVDAWEMAVTQQTVRTEELRQQIPMAQQPRQLQIDQILPMHGQAGQLLVLAENGFHERFLFRLGAAGATIDYLNRWTDNGYATAEMSLAENGRFVTVVRYNSWRTHITLHDLETNKIKRWELVGRPLYHYAWSADGAWLVLADDRLLWLLAPAYDYALPIPHTHRNCTAVSWLE